MSRPTTLRRGQRITAEWLNRLVRAVLEPPRVRAGHGVDVQKVGDSVVVSVRSPVVRRYDGQITAAPAPGVPIDPATALYAARAAPPFSDAFKFPVTGSTARPKYGIHSEPGQPGPKVFPAKVGDDCVIIVREDPVNEGEYLIELEVKTERVSWAPCAS